MMIRSLWNVLTIAFVLLTFAASKSDAADLIPPLDRIATDHPRVFLRPAATPLAVSLEQLRAGPKDDAYKQLLQQLRNQDSASAQAMVWLLTGDNAAADKAIARMRAYKFPGNVDTFHTYFRLMEFGLAYDWLYDYDGFTPSIKAEVRGNVVPLARHGIRVANDHMFHNYIWMSAGGVALWAFATAGEDDAANDLFEQIRARFNDGLFPAWKYLDGLPSEPMGYWALYVLSPGVLTVLGAQSAFETDVVGAIESDGDWLDRHFENLIQSTLPNLRYLSWGDLQGGPNGSVTHEMAGVIDALTWATDSPHGAWFSERIADRRGLARFYGDTPIFYFLYTTHLQTRPQAPSLGFLAGGEHSGHFIARSSWDDDGTVVAFTCTDHFGDHHHYDQGSFIVYREGLLAVDPPVYPRIRGPQQPTDVHCTLLIGGQPQRPARGQWFRTIEDFQKNLMSGRMLETGDIPFYQDAGEWAAVAGRFDQAYADGLVGKCVRQLLFIRPDTVVIVDQLAPPEGGSMPEVQWLFQAPREPAIEGAAFTTTNGESWLRFRSLVTNAAAPTVEATDVNTHRVTYRYSSEGPMSLVHVIEVGDGANPTQPAGTAKVSFATEGAIEVTVGGSTYSFATSSPFGVKKQ